MPYRNLKTYLVFFIFLLSLNVAKAQPGKEAWHWQFGDSCALDFSSGTPVVGHSSLNSFASAASISDANTGALLFYTEGGKVWDKNNNLMPNGTGLNGDYHYQSVLIVPKPGSNNLYYIFCANGQNTTQSIYYSIVDMNQNSGLGDITIKNQLLYSGSVNNKLTAVKNCNGTDYWLITHSLNSNTFQIYSVTSNGINTTAVTSAVGSSFSSPNLFSINAIKAAPNGKKIAVCVGNYTQNIVEIYDFNSSTGIVSNPTTISFSKKEVDGISFSPDSKKLYSNILVPTNSIFYVYNDILQYDVSTSIPTAITASQNTVASIFSTWGMNAMQIAPDGKIYICDADTNTISVINNPNNYGIACNVQKIALTIPYVNTANDGLPNFIDANYTFSTSEPLTNLYNMPLCSFNSFILTADAGTNYNWYNASTNSTVTISDTGKYWVNYLDAKGCKEVDTFYVTHLAQAPVIDNLHNMEVCSNYIPLSVNATCPNTLNYVWYDSTKTAVNTFTNAGTYWVNYYLNNNCVSRDSFNLSIKHIILPDSFPNIVTPNNDGVNDFIDFSKYRFATLQLEIYNRWGNKVFESNDPNCIWKPTEEDGTYFMLAQYSVSCGNTNEKLSAKTFITLIK